MPQKNDVKVIPVEEEQKASIKAGVNYAEDEMFNELARDIEETVRITL